MAMMRWSWLVAKSHCKRQVAWSWKPPVKTPTNWRGECGYLLLLSLALVVSVLQVEDVAPLKPGGRFDYSKSAFQPESWKKRGLSF
jgi:hypothetical protein